LFDWITEGKLRVRIGAEYPLADAARAHADMESRKTTGKLLLAHDGLGRKLDDCWRQRLSGRRPADRKARNIEKRRKL
jgi:hypothetical protein